MVDRTNFNILRYIRVAKFVKIFHFLDLHTTTSLACVGIGGFLTSIFMALWSDGTVLPKTTSDIPIILLGGLFSLLTNFCVTMAMKMELAGKVALTAKSTQILFSFIFQVLFFNVSKI